MINPEKYNEFQKLEADIISMSIDSMFVHNMWTIINYKPILRA